MPTKPLDRLLFAQGGLCFFCRLPLPKGEASVEHLVASSNGGANTDDNCVACCITVNAMFGRMSLKEKIQVVLNQQGNFRCPNGNKPPQPAATVAATVKTAPKTAKGPAKKAKAPPAFKPADFALVVTNLEQRGESRPRTMKALTSTIAALFPAGITHAEVAGIVRQLQKTGHAKVDATKVTYPLFAAPTSDARPAKDIE